MLKHLYNLFIIASDDYKFFNSCQYEFLILSTTKEIVRDFNQIIYIFTTLVSL